MKPLAARSADLPAPFAGRRLRVLFLVSAHNSLSQRVEIALTELGHRVTVAVVASGDEMEHAVERHRPELIVCPMLKAIIPESIYTRHRCLVVHPGPVGDRGPSSLDWAIELGAGEWGVTVLEAAAEVDAGDIWATRTFPTRDAGKSSLYRHEVRRAAVDAVVEAVTAVASGRAASRPLDYRDPSVTGRLRPLIKQADRAIDWETDTTATIAAAHQGGRGPSGRARQLRRRAVPPVRRAPRAHAARASRRADRPAPRCDLPRDRGRRRLDHAPQVAGLLQAAGHARARRRRAAGRRARARRVRRDRLHRARRRRLPVVRLLQRRHEHRAVPAPARRLPPRGRPQPDPRDRADGRPRLLLQRHPPQRHRGGRRPGRRVVVQPARDRRDRARDRRDRVAPGDLRARRRRRSRRRAVRARRRLRRGARGRRAQPVLPAHGRPLWLGVLDLPAPAPDRPGGGAPADVGAVQGDRHAPRDRARAHRRGVRRHGGELPRRGARHRRAPGARPGAAGDARGQAQRPPPRRAAQAPRHLPDRGARPLTRVLLRRATGATTTRGTASCTSSARPAPCPFSPA